MEPENSSFCRGTPMTASSSVTTSSFPLFWDCTSIANRKWNSSSLFASTRKKLCQFPYSNTVFTTRFRTTFPRFSLVAVFNKSTLLLSQTRWRRDSPERFRSTHGRPEKFFHGEEEMLTFCFLLDG